MDDYPAAEPIPDLALHHETLMDFLVHSDAMRVTAKHALRQGLYAGGGAVAGALVAGPLGGLMGGIAGSVLGFWQTPNYEGILQHLLALDPAQQERLIKAVKVVLLAAGASQLQTPQAFQTALLGLASQRHVREQVWNACLEAVR